MVRLIFFIIILLLLCSCAPTQTDKTFPKDKGMEKIYTQISAEDLVRFEFSHGKFNSFMDQASEAMMFASRPVLEKELKKRVTPSGDKEVFNIYKKVLSEVYQEEEWIEQLSKLYARNFTTDEINELFEFYQTNSGRRLLEMQSTIMHEAKEMATIIFKNKEEIFVERLQEEISTAFSARTHNVDIKSKDTDLLSVSETIKSCIQMQESPETPINCAFYYYDGRPAMIVNLQSYKTAELYWDAIKEKISGPFCQSANEANIEVNIIINIQPFNMVRFLSCETNEWSKWINVKLRFQNNK